MIYLSKGVLCKSNGKNDLYITRGSETINITDMDAQVWLNGRFGFSDTESAEQENSVLHLSSIGLMEYEQEDNNVNRYRILTRGVCCAAKVKEIWQFASRSERTIMRWINYAGIRLSTAELVYLTENNIYPDDSLLRERNRQTLVERIYTTDTIFDNILENIMEKAKCRDDVVCTIMKLVAERRIIIL